MQKFKSHKTVEAAKITAIELDQDTGGARIGLYVAGGDPLDPADVIDVNSFFLRRVLRPGGLPSDLIGGYLIRYAEDGYLSWSPGEIFEKGYSLEGVDVEAVAKITHEANRVWCAYNGDASQVPWDEAPDWQRASARSGVRFHLDNPTAGDSASHDEWMRHKLADGWTYGPVKDPEAKTHFCLVPFDELPPEQQFKDRLFRTLVHAAAG